MLTGSALAAKEASSRRGCALFLLQNLLTMMRFAAEGCLRAGAVAQNITIMSSPPHPRLRMKQVATKESSGMDRKIAVSYSIHLFRNQAFADGQRFGCKGGVQQAWLRIVSCAKTS